MTLHFLLQIFLLLDLFGGVLLILQQFLVRYLHLLQKLCKLLSLHPVHIDPIFSKYLRSPFISHLHVYFLNGVSLHLDNLIIVSRSQVFVYGKDSLYLSCILFQLTEFIVLHEILHPDKLSIRQVVEMRLP